MSIAGVEVGAAELGKKMGSPGESKGRGFSFIEKMLVGEEVGTRLFLPLDLQANIEKRKEFKQSTVCEEVQRGRGGPTEERP